MEEWKVNVQIIDATLVAKVYIWRRVGDQVNYLNNDEKGLIATSVKYSDGFDLDIKPFMIGQLPTIMAIVRGFLAYANSEGLKSGDETFAKGKLEATEKHLEDMRKIVFEPIITGSPKK